MEFHGFENSLFAFLEDLADHNERAWFQENKLRYEREVLQPSLAFVRAFRPHLQRISSCFVASDQRTGGSLMRVYRDTRFARDKTPYKTNVGIQFRHEFGKDVHAPGFYVHLEPDECFLALGVWRPDKESLTAIRAAIVEHPDRWKRARDDRKFRACFQLDGESLKRPPRDFPADHPLVEDLKRTDFVALQQLSQREVLQPQFINAAAAAFSASKPFMRFLCDALRVPF